ncbi:restriction endonuclease subunit S [Sphingobacterium sp. UDSM-2020]|uniref:restriction endonuclease subunit S n=1 Tax=Sphingobacterium sp. UDSM-2020 TaxID=2795738 RepID=UPI001935FE54|nr:restriction endonuclease subunit S [Sphingobacterium sp. UDSM-2020]QQD15061.1 restriction endonuclease subunit S [Sphingobacterium sp. UDSM-2020]
MTKHNEHKNIPELRFPEFKDDGEWEEKTLGEVAERIEEKVNGKKLTTASISAGTGFVSQAEKFSRDISGAQYKNYIVLNEGEFSYNKGNSKRFPQGCIYKLKEFKQVAVPNAFISFRFKPNFVGDFFQGYFDNNYHGIQLMQFITSGARMDGLLNIKADEFFSVVLPAPSESEQQKIAEILLSLNEMITANTEKLEVLKDYKKGLMQVLFPQEGEKVPKFRFPEIKDYGEWEEKPLKEVFSIFQGFAFSSDDSVSSGARWLKIADVGVQQMKDDVPSYLPQIYIEKFRKFTVKKGDYVLALTRPILNMRLKLAQVDDKFHDALLNQRVGKIVTSNNSSFVYYLLQMSKMVETINKNIAGKEPPNLSFLQIEDIKVFLPSEINEQQRIAETLSSLDELIVAQSDKIEQLKIHKKGLMQKLFPAIK